MSKLEKTLVQLEKIALIEGKLTFIDLVQHGRTLYWQFLNDILLGEMNAFYFTPPCGAQKLLEQDIKIGHTLRLVNFLRRGSVYKRQGSKQKKEVLY